MSTPSNRRSRKRFSATRLFVARGFDQVTVGEIAAAAAAGG
jgi:AcrR family transcriptional regulator